MTKKTLEQLQNDHSEMCAAAHDLGMTVPEDLTKDFETVEAGRTIVSNLDALIRKHREGLDADKKQVAEDVKEDDNSSPKSSTKK